MSVPIIAKAVSVVIPISFNNSAGSRVNPSSALVAADFKVLNAAGSVVTPNGLSVVANPSSLVGAYLVVIDQSGTAYAEDTAYTLWYDPQGGKTIDSQTPISSWGWVCRTEAAASRKGIAINNFPFQLYLANGAFAQNREQGGLNAATIQRFDPVSGDFVAANASTIITAAGVVTGRYLLNVAAADNPATNAVNGLWFRISEAGIKDQDIFIPVR